MVHSHVIVIDPAVHTVELDCFNRMARASPKPLTYHLPALYGMASVRAASDGACGVIVLGSASSVRDRLPWQRELADWLGARMDAGLPTLGLCFGHQLIADIYGAGVEFVHSDQRKLEGFEATQLAATELWGEGRRIALYTSHREHVIACPAGMRVIAQREHVPYDGFAHERLPIWTLQQHPEATPAFLANRGRTHDGDATVFAAGHDVVDRFVRFACTR